MSLQGVNIFLSHQGMLNTVGKMCEDHDVEVDF